MVVFFKVGFYLVCEQTAVVRFVPIFHRTSLGPLTLYVLYISTSPRLFFKPNFPSPMIQWLNCRLSSMCHFYDSPRANGFAP